MLCCGFWWSGLTAFFFQHVFSFEKSRRCDNNQQITVSHFGEHKRLHLESSKQNYYMISLRAIIKAIFTSHEMPKSNKKIIPIQNKFVIVYMCFVLFTVCLYICVCECLLQNNNHETKHQNSTISQQHEYVRGPLRECRSIRSGASGLLYYCAPLVPYYCTPLVCDSEVIESLAVWRHNKPKSKNQGSCCI